MKPFDSNAFQRLQTGQVLQSLETAPQLLQIMIGPRQVGKTTAAAQIMAQWKGATHYAAADESLPPGPEWIEQHWQTALKQGSPAKPCLLVLDEVQKISRWSESVKKYWDAARMGRHPIRVLLLGSSALLMQKGLGESLAGRFLLHRFGHWSLVEMRAAFKFDLEDWLIFGGYPGAAALKADKTLWQRYVHDSLIEVALVRDVLQMQSVAKPALLRHLFGLSATYPAQILSYNKMLGQLQDAGNTTTLSHYLKLLESAFLISGLEPWRNKAAKRGGSPKLIAWNNALISALPGGMHTADPSWRGRLVENAAGAHLLNHLPPGCSLYYWRQGELEVDFVVAEGKRLWALEIKSGRPRPTPGLAAFKKMVPRVQAMVIGAGGMDLEEFFNVPPAQWMR